jgi:hypothetical protein
MATRRQRWEDLKNDSDRNAAEEGEFNDLQAELDRLGRFVDEVGPASGENPEDAESGLPRTTTGEIATSAENNPNQISGEPELEGGQADTDNNQAKNQTQNQNQTNNQKAKRSGR